MMSESKKQTVIIVGAGPAGLTAAYELLSRSRLYHPIILEKWDYIGGISRTYNFKGNRIDIGGHRFFSKSDRVMNWWLHFLPIQAGYGTDHGVPVSTKAGQASAQAPEPEATDLVMLVRKRLSRVFYLRKFFDYPITLNKTTVFNLGLWRMMRIGFSYIRVCLFPIKPEKNLEDFFINRFGRELYRTFFESYTEKVWGVPCRNINPEWGAQRVKGLSVLKTLLHAFKQLFGSTSGGDIRQKQVETSLIEQFLYPKLGPGQIWEEVARQIVEKGGEILMNREVTRILTDNGKITGVETKDRITGSTQRIGGDYLLSSMPIKDLVGALDCPKPKNVADIAQGLVYRDFITVGMLLKNFKSPEKRASALQAPIRDCWIYVQEPDVQVGRIQIFNNWSPYLVNNPEHAWVGLEYFCQDTDAFWKKPDAEIIKLATEELQRMGFIQSGDVLDATVLRMEKTYPAYFGSYDRFDEVRGFLDTVPNLFLMGRNGMHRYNNQDHSMLTAMTIVDLMLEGKSDKSAVWSVNAEQSYHETKES